MTALYPRCWAEIDTDALAHNVRALSSLGSEIMAVVKANAYGHGVDLVVPALLKMGIRHFGVATVVEGEEARALADANGASDAAIYIIAAALPEEAGAIVENRLIPLVSDLDLAKAISRATRQAGKEAQIHIEIDTGIGRAGVAPTQAPAFLAECSALPGLRVAGICSHFTAADAEDTEDARLQYALFEKALATLPADKLAQLTLHTANSPGILRIPAARLQLIRPGLLLYGIGPSPQFLADSQEPFGFKPVLSLKARALLVRRLPAGSDISYGRTYTLPHEATIATLGIGYGDGFPRRLSNKGYALLPTGARAPIRGRVCMDQICVEIPEGAKAQVGDTFTLIGQAGGEEILATHLAHEIDATPHEITTCLTARVPRVLI
ncbi:MAG TPA: alanine racemase [Capsulimonadaceae bacterium]|nr:alanine racemase [Capsulimonadaceae bacterium]